MSAALKTGADARAMRNTRFPEEFSKKVDMSKVNLPVIKKWVSDEITKILQSDDDVVTEMIFTILEGSKFPNIKQLQTDVAGFLDKDAPSFCLELWKLCLSAQSSPNGIPKELLEAKKLELLQERIAEEKAQEEARKREAEERERERDLARIRDRERNQRGRGGRGGRGRGRDRSFDRRPARDSRSPPRRRDRDSGRGADSYMPGGRGGRDGRDDNRRRRRSPSYGRSPSRSRSPPRRRRRRNSSSEISRSPAPRRRRNTSSEVEEDRFRRRSPPRRRRRSPSRSDDSRSPPNRRRRPSPSRSRSPPRRGTRDRSRSRTPPSRGSRRLSRDDLMSKSDRKNNYRLSRENSSYSNTPDGDRRGSQSEKSTNGGAKDERAPRNPLRISKEELQARLFTARLEAQRRANLQRRDSGTMMPPVPPFPGKQ